MQQQQQYVHTVHMNCSYCNQLPVTSYIDARYEVPTSTSLFTHIKCSNFSATFSRKKYSQFQIAIHTFTYYTSSHSIPECVNTFALEFDIFCVSLTCSFVRSSLLFASFDNICESIYLNLGLQS